MACDGEGRNQGQGHDHNRHDGPAVAVQPAVVVGMVAAMPAAVVVRCVVGVLRSRGSGLGCSLRLGRRHVRGVFGLVGGIAHG